MEAVGEEGTASLDGVRSQWHLDSSCYINAMHTHTHMHARTHNPLTLVLSSSFPYSLLDTTGSFSFIQDSASLELA